MEKLKKKKPLLEEKQSENENECGSEESVKKQIINNNFIRIKEENKSKNIKRKENKNLVNSQEIAKKSDLSNVMSCNGSFKNGDIPKKVIDCYKDNGKIFFKIEWKKRKNGFIPKETTIETQNVIFFRII